MKHITSIAGARPNFMKIAPIIHAIQKHNTEGGEFCIIHLKELSRQVEQNNLYKEIEKNGRTKYKV